MLKPVCLDWDELAEYRGNPIIRVSPLWLALIPACVASLRKLPDKISFFLDKKAPIEVLVELPFSWWCLWAASVSATLGLVLFYFGAPPLFKKYAGYETFRQSARGASYLFLEALATARSESRLPKCCQSFDRVHLVAEVAFLAARRIVIVNDDDGQRTSISISGSVPGQDVVRNYPNCENYVYKPNEQHSRSLIERLIDDSNLVYGLYYFDAQPMAGEIAESHLSDLEVFNQRAYRTYFVTSKRSLYPLRIVCTFLFYLAAACYGFVFLQSVWTVVRYLASVP